MGVPVVGIGASAGGLESLQSFFEAVPVDSGMAFVVIQHLSPHFKSMMGQLLARSTSLPIEVASSGTEVQPNRVYLLPPGKLMVIVDQRLVLADKSKDGVDFPIDCFLESLGRAQGAFAAGVILSGTGSDGSRGVSTICDLGGVSFAEVEATAKFHGMPRSAIATGKLTGVLPPDEMPAALIEAFAKAKPPRHVEDDTVEMDRLATIFTRIRERHGVDYSLYKPATITRRLKRRAELEGLKLDELIERAGSDAELQDKLYQDFLITVTKFFRDPWCFDELQNQLRQLVVALSPEEEVRIWCAGCATGEEAFSLAIVVDECLKALSAHREWRVFATDINPDSLRIAEEGLYTSEQLVQVSASRMDNYFEKGSQGLRVQDRLRSRVLFQRHDLLHDVPFTNVHVVCCRNLLIYLDQQAQKKALSFFHFGLNRGGLLMLGASETTESVPGAFNLRSENARIFQKAQRLNINHDLADRIRTRALESHRAKRNQVDEERLALYDTLCNRFMPPSILLDGQRQVLETFGGAEKYLSIKGRRFSHDFLDLLDSDLKGSIAGALRMLERNDEPLVVRSIELAVDGQKTVLDLRLELLPITNSEEPRILVSLIEESAATDERKAAEFSSHRAADDELMRLESELADTRAYLQESIERAEASNQELHATNEELIASNEELQSTNEELSSVNEELYTINSEYQNSIRELRDANADISHLLSNTNIATLFLDSDLAIRRFTPHIARVIDVVENDIGRKVTSFQHKLQWPDFFDSLRTVLKTGESIIEETRATDGTRYVVRIHAYRTGSETEGVVVTLTDVTRLAQTQAALADREGRLEQLADPLPMLISYVDSNERYRFVNREYEKVWQRERGSLIGLTVKEVLGPNNYRKAKPSIDAALTGKPTEFEMMADFPAGSQWIRVNYIPHLESDGTSIGFYVTATDLTEQHQAAEALRAARDASAHASQAKTEFLANMSHEIRTPLTAIMGYAELLTNETQTERGTDYVKTIRRNGRHLLAIINDVLDLSRIEEGRLDLERESFSIMELIGEVHELFRLRSRDRGIALRVEFPEKVPQQVESDPRRIRQILFNLVSNAIKFTEDGSVTIKLYEIDRKDPRLRIEVRDTGIGFPQEKAETLFEPFKQLDGSGARRHEGSGLGLAICSRLVQALQGKIRAQSVTGAGSSFLIDIPVEVERDTGEVEASRAALSSQPAPTTSQRLDCRLLIVDDKRDVRELLKEGLTLAGATVETLSSGTRTLKLHETEGLDAFDVILMDVQMPGIDGLATTERLRELGVSIPIIALTARALERDREECLKAGFSGYLPKPVDQLKLVHYLNDLLEDHEDASRSGAERQPTTKLAVLIVDDHEDSAELITTVLQAKGFNASYELNIEAARKRLMKSPPDFLISDINFGGEPVGLDLAKEVRKQQPNIRMAALSGADIEAQALRAGFDHFFTKPCSPERLVDWLRS